MEQATGAEIKEIQSLERGKLTISAFFRKSLNHMRIPLSLSQSPPHPPPHGPSLRMLGLQSVQLSPLQRD